MLQLNRGRVCILEGRLVVWFILGLQDMVKKKSVCFDRYFDSNTIQQGMMILESQFLFLLKKIDIQRTAFFFNHCLNGHLLSIKHLHGTGY